MILRVLIFVLVVATIFWVRQKISRLPAAQRRLALRQAIFVTIGVVLILLVATGRVHWLFALFGALLPFAQRVVALLRFGQMFKNSPLGQIFSSRANGTGNRDNPHSAIETDYLRMRLDHRNGELSGTVLKGKYHGRELNELNLSALLELLRELRVQDEESASLLEAYLDRTHADWRDNTGENTYHNEQNQEFVRGKMSIAEACQILGVEEADNAETVRAAHKRLIQKMHPDRGGSNYLATKINQAKDVLLSRKER